jgi:glycerol-3-phosphate O-acyltransferase
VLGLVRARKYLQRRFGSVHVDFSEPISLAQALGDRREALSRVGDEAAEVERRQFVESLGLRIVEAINWSAVANATSLAGCVVMGAPHRGLARPDFVARMRIVMDLLQLQGARVTPALLADRADFEDAIAFLKRSDLLKSNGEGDDEILYFEESHRRALDMYRNGVAHFLSAPSVLARRLLAGADAKELEEDLNAWSDLLYQEYFSPGGEALDERRERIVALFGERRWIAAVGERWVATDAGAPVLRFLAEQTRGVLEAYRAVCDVADDPGLRLDRAAFLRRTTERLERDRLLGRAHRPEAANDTTFQNAIDLLVRRGILERREEEIKPEKRGRRARVATVYAPGERFDGLGALRERLVAGLADEPADRGLAGAPTDVG